ncbi:MAG TPA: molybdopterin-synthase adenylyltransferase MoeB, partial [Planktothrix sp.]
PEIGQQGQRRLKASSVVVIGAGGLGSPAAMYLAAAGVGRIGIVDFDTVDLSNLQRQIIHASRDVGMAKTESARERLAQINPEIVVELFQEKIAADNVESIIASYDIVIDASDNFSTRYLINDACVLGKKPNVFGAIYRFEGQASVFAPDAGPCYRCLFPAPPPPDAVPNCAEGGVLGVLAGTIGTIQATEALKLLLGIGQPLIGRLLKYDALAMRFDTLKLSRTATCPVCGDNPSITSVQEVTVNCETKTMHHHPASGVVEISPVELNAKLKTDRDKIVLLDVRQPNEHSICHLKNCVLIPLNELPERMGELDKDAEIVAYCKMGGRSHRAVEFLNANGFKNIKNLVGGILGWIEQVDQSMPSY